MWSFFSVVVVCWTVLFLVRFQLPRVLAQITRTAEETLPPPSPPPPDPIPPDLLQLALRESEGWAKEAAVKSMYELYEGTRDWNKVRALWKPYPSDILN